MFCCSFCCPAVCFFCLWKDTSEKIGTCLFIFYFKKSPPVCWSSSTPGTNVALAQILLKVLLSGIYCKNVRLYSKFIRNWVDFLTFSCSSSLCFVSNNFTEKSHFLWNSRVRHTVILYSCIRKKFVNERKVELDCGIVGAGWILDHLVLMDGLIYKLLAKLYRTLKYKCCIIQMYVMSVSRALSCVGRAGRPPLITVRLLWKKSMKLIYKSVRCDKVWILCSDVVTSQPHRSDLLSLSPL